jgi:2-C-methyl-D-erythritol 4-phosphate cytidylyltransferase/2-C-methyl-D-erythritol 2,4-cyclodiphosphate synthase
MSLAIIVVAAGRGERLGRGIPKALVQIDGKTILEHCLDNLPDHELIVVGPKDHLDEFRSLIPESAKLVTGGETRQQSALNGLQATTAEKVLIHDAARCFTPLEVFDRVAEALETFDAVIPAVKITDTIKQIDGQMVVNTLDRNQLVAAQTPQGFDREKLLSSFSDLEVTDEAMLMEKAGHAVGFVEGDIRSKKITTEDDLDSDVYVGTGVDSHKFSDAGVLMLGTMAIEGYPKLEGHSDGDALSHAVVDAMLAAARLGDIGSVYGIDEPKFAGASGELFINETMQLLEKAGFQVVNVSCQLVADEPKISPIRKDLQAKLSDLIGAPVSILATTTDGLGFLKDASGVGAVATASLKKAR